MSTIESAAVEATLSGAPRTITVAAVDTGDAMTTLILLCLQAAQQTPGMYREKSRVFEYLRDRFAMIFASPGVSGMGTSSAHSALGHWAYPAVTSASQYDPSDNAQINAKQQTDRVNAMLAAIGGLKPD